MLINAQPNAQQAYKKLNLDLEFNPSYGKPDVVLNHWQVPIIEGTKTYGGTKTTRVERLQIAEGKCPVMEWEVASKNPSFDEFVFKGDRKEPTVIKKEDLIDFNEGDVICKLVHPTDGTLYKIESLNGEVILGWKSERPIVPLEKPRRSYERELWDIPKQVIIDFKPLHDYFKENKFGYVSIDLMKDPQGVYKLIEFNDNFVAINWSSRFDVWKQRLEEIIPNML